MKDCDYKMLDKWSYGIGRKYAICPNYSDESTRKLIDSRLAELSR